MAWFGIRYAPPEQIRRLEEAAAGNLAAQASLHQAGEDAAKATRGVRREAVLARRQEKRAARSLREQAMHTGYVRELVEEMFSDMDHRADHRAQKRH